MAISVCELCNKPFNSGGAKVCVPCSKSLDETYVKVRKYIYQNPHDCEFITIVEATEVSEKELNYLIKKGRVEVVYKDGSGLRCRACGKETTGSTICEACRAKIVSEKLSAKETAPPENKEVKATKKVLPISYND